MPADIQPVNSTSDRWLFIAFLCLLLFAPLPYGSRLPFGWSILVIGVCVIGVFWLWQYGRGRVQITEPFHRAWPAHIALLLWLGWVVLQIVPLPIGVLEWISPSAARFPRETAAILGEPEPIFATLSLYAWESQSAVLLTVGLIGAYVLSLLLVNNTRRLTLLAWTLVYSGLVQAIYGSVLALSGIEQWVLPNPGMHDNLARGSFTNRNHYAGYLVMCLSMGIGLMLGMLKDRKHETWRRWLRSWLEAFLSPKLRLRLYLIIMVIALVLTRSRMGNASFFAALLLVGVVALLFSNKAKQSMMVLIASLIIIDIVIIGTWFGIDKVTERLKETVMTEETIVVEYGQAVKRQTVVIDAQERGKLNRDQMAYFKDYWLVGSGLGSFEYVYPLYKGSDVLRNSKLHHDHAHNDYLEFLVEVGIVGFTLLGFMIIWTLKIVVTALVKRRDGIMVGMAFAALMSMAALLIHSAVDFNLRVAGNAFTFMVILAIAILSATLPHEEKRKQNET